MCPPWNPSSASLPTTFSPTCVRSSLAFSPKTWKPRDSLSSRAASRRFRRSKRNREANSERLSTRSIRTTRKTLFSTTPPATQRNSWRDSTSMVASELKTTLSVLERYHNSIWHACHSPKISKVHFYKDTHTLTQIQTFALV